MQDVWLSWVCI